MTYEPVPGTFDHRGMDCATHGENVPHARPRGELGPFHCVRCLLDAACLLEAQAPVVERQPVQEWWEAT